MLPRERVLGGVVVNKRELKLEKYGISGKRYKELCGFCEQYPEWQEELLSKSDTLQSVEITDMPIPPHGNSDKTGNLAIRRVELKKKCEIVEKTAKEANEELYQFLIKGICYGVSYNYLLAFDGIPMSRSSYYELRRYFFYLLDKNKGM